MKYKFPKKITLGNTQFNIRYDKSDGGGSFAYPFKNTPGLIVIGTKELKSNPNDFLSIVTHELSEILHVELYQRFNHGDNKANFLFSYSHKEFTIHTNLLVTALREFIQ